MRKPVFETFTGVVLSTAHITREDASNMAADAQGPGLIVDEFEYGFMVWIPRADGVQDEGYNQRLEEYSEAFRQLIHLAQQAGWRYLRLDCDAEVYEQLPTFDW